MTILIIDEEEGKGVKPTWVDKNDIKVSEPRVLKLVKEIGDISNLKDPLDNALIRGDNLLALRTLVELFKNRDEKDKVKCIYIDPPYNTGSAFEHYDDNLMRSEWLTMMRDRLRLLKKLLRKDGIICVQINDTQVHYLKLLMDEIFSTENYFSTIYVQTVYPEKTLKQDRIFHDIIEQILIYKNNFKVNVNQDYEEYNWDKFEWFVEEKNKSPISIEMGGTKVEILKKGEFEIIKKSPSTEGLKEIWASGTILDINSSGRFFRDYLAGRYKKDGLGCLYKVYDIGDDGREYRYFTGPQREGATKGKYYQGVPLRQLTEETARKSKKSIENFWNLAAEFGNCRQEGGVELKSGKKPERLVKKLLHHFTNKNDLVLDSFLGSGTTCAVAHKMNRKWIGVEIGNQAETHCLVRLKSVIDTSNPDRTGISKDEDINWQGGNGFRYYKLPDSLIGQNKYSNPELLKDMGVKHETDKEEEE